MPKRLPRRRREAVAKRAGHRCEYCHALARLSLGHFHTDHIQSRKRGGADDLVNLGYACPLCNENKLDVVEARDPLTGQVVRLFNPRTDEWDDHFSWSADGLDIVGRTPIGRATIATLKMNDDKRRYLRTLWKKLGLHPPPGDSVAEE